MFVSKSEARMLAPAPRTRHPSSWWHRARRPPKRAHACGASFLFLPGPPQLSALLGGGGGLAVTPEWAAAGQATETAGGARPLPAGEESCEIHVLCLPPTRTATDPGTPGESPRLAVRCLRVWVAVLSQPRAPGCPRHPRMAQSSPPIRSGASPVCM